MRWLARIILAGVIGCGLPGQEVDRPVPDGLGCPAPSERITRIDVIDEVLVINDTTRVNLPSEPVPNLPSLGAFLSNPIPDMPSAPASMRPSRLVFAAPGDTPGWVVLAVTQTAAAAGVGQVFFTVQTEPG